MNEALQLAQQRIQELEQQIAQIKRDESQVVLLPNGDLHRGIRMQQSKPNISEYNEVVPDGAGNKLNVAMSKILTAAKGGHSLTCLWCGLQYDGHGSEKDMREHLKKDHPSVVQGWDSVTSEVLMANLDEAKNRLAEAEAQLATA